MRTVDGLENLGTNLEGSILTIGNFDGVHLAHQALVRRVAQSAQESNTPAVALTFDPHPLAVVAPHRVPPVLTPRAEKLRLLEALGLSCVVIARSAPELLNLEAERFIREVVVPRLRPWMIVEGSTFGFGKGRRGNVELLAKLGRELGFQLFIVDAVIVELGDGSRETVSSSLVRRFLAEGRLTDAARCLGRPYRLMGQVVAGQRRGRTLGFPTANLEVADQAVPAEGVYAGTAEVADRPYPCAVSIGKNPTFGGEKQRIEVHLIGFSGDLYGQPLSVDLHAWVRGQRPFPSADDLVRQLRRDVETIRSTGATP